METRSSRRRSSPRRSSRQRRVKVDKLSNIKLSLDQGLSVENDLRPDRFSGTLAQILGVERAYLLRRSVDARKKGDVHFVVTAAVGEGNDTPRAVTPIDKRPVPEPDETGTRPVVVGTGPAGLFAALELAEAGKRPLVIERGAPVDERTADIDQYHKTRVLNTRSNVQFGEGGAGTFSDGKLTTGKNSPLIQKVLELFVAAGAPQEILWQAKPHIGTDVLGGVVMRLRERIVACGGEVRFHTKLSGFDLAADGSLRAVDLEGPDGGVETVEARQLVLATGHSARDTFSVLKVLGFELEQKPFSLGVRIEHSQKAINEAQYGKAAGHAALGAADYKLSCHLRNKRSVYTFCMCPGGEVVAASSEEGRLCVNGMSHQARAGVNANAALLCNVVPEDFPDPTDPLSGIAFQRTWEEAAFKAGGSDWRAPMQTLGSFMGHKSSSDLVPSYPLGVTETKLDACLPSFAAEALREAIPVFGKRLRGYDAKGALLTGIEARSSSPVRIVRDAKTLMATRNPGVYPCGEGAGYAGGIMSAAVDGIRVAQAMLVS